MESHAPIAKSLQVPVTSGLEQRCTIMCEHLSVQNCTDTCRMLRHNAQCPTDNGWNAEHAPFTSTAYTKCQDKCTDDKHENLEACATDCQFLFLSPCVNPQSDYIAQCENTCMNKWSNALCKMECTKYLLPECVTLLKRSNNGSNQLNDKDECLEKCTQMSNDIGSAMHANNAPLTLAILEKYTAKGCNNACKSTHFPIASASVCSDVFAAPFQNDDTPKSLPPT
jgi:hypothetical protein